MKPWFAGDKKPDTFADLEPDDLIGEVAAPEADYFPLRRLTSAALRRRRVPMNQVLLLMPGAEVAVVGYGCLQESVAINEWR